MKLLHDLRRRRVFRLAGLYIVGAWVVIQVAEALFQAWGIPETANRFVFIAAALCFPVALIFSWIFDITSEGIVRTRKAGADESVSMQLQTKDYGILAALAAIGVVVVLGSFERIQEEIESGHVETVALERRANSIAVLPFKNLDLNDPSGYFSIGVTEEILHRLSSLGALHVLASTSSFSFRDSDQPPAEISARLGVSFLLDGSIRRSDDTVRVTARLLDGEGFQVWSQTFDRELEEIFLVQTDIARAVSEEIVDEIVPLAELPAGRTTDNMEAYNAYLLGRYEGYNRIIGWKDRAREAFEKAIELDPGFAPPYAGLAMLVVNTDRGPHWEEALDVAAKSLELDPDLAEGHAVTGLIKVVLEDPAAGQAALERAIQLDPSLSTAYAWLTIALNRQGKREAAAQVEMRGIEIDPFNTILVVNAAIKQSERGDFERAEQLRLRLMSLPQLSGAAFTIVDFYDAWGRYDKELDITSSIIAKAPREELGGPVLTVLARTHAKLGMTEEADYWRSQAIAALPELEGDIHDAYYLYRLYDDSTPLEEALRQFERTNPELHVDNDPSSLAYGALAQVRVGNYEMAVDWFDLAFDVFYKLYDSKEPDTGVDVELFRYQWPDSLVLPISLSMAHAYQQVGRDADATATLRRVAEALDEFPLKDPESLQFAALQRALNGEIDASYEFLRAAVDIGWANYYEVTNDPAWARALQDERIAALLEIAKDRVSEQRASVEAWQTDEDFRGVVERWLSR
jgi:TolB-like protein/tetratricopeptide (TPR) repeat protein